MSDRVLHCNNDNKNLGGAYIVTRRVDEYMRKYGWIFDYVTMDEFVDTGNKDLDVLLGCKTFSANMRKNRLIGHLKMPFFTYRTVRDNKYHLVHIDTDTAWKAMLYAFPAKMAGAKVIVHSHSTGIDGDYRKIKKLFHKINRGLLPRLTDLQIACSKEAMKWMFPENKWKNTLILFNGIDLKKFYFDENIRNEYRKKLHVDNDEFLIGHIGKICANKNQIFLIKVLRKVLDCGICAKLILVGSYNEEWKNKIEFMIREFDVSANVIMYGVTDKTNELLNAMDAFAFPSYFEGAPLSVCEAQATGLPCVVSNSVSKSVSISNWIEFEENEMVDCWCEHIKRIKESKRNRKECMISDDYGLEKMAKTLNEAYKRIK